MNKPSVLNQTFSQPWSRLTRHALAAGALLFAIGSASAQVATTTLAGLALQSGNTDGTLVSGVSSARFSTPIGVAVDSVNGFLYVADSANHTIRKIVISTGAVSTFAGSAGTNGTTDAPAGPATTARFKNPSGLALDGAGNLYVADTGNYTIRKIVIATGVVSTVAGTAGTFSPFANGVGGAATFFNPFGIAVDRAGAGGTAVNAFVSDGNNNVIRKIVLSSGTVSTLAGGTATTPNAAGFADGAATAAQFNGPKGIAVDAAGTTVYVADANNNRIRAIVAATGATSTFAGSGAAGSSDNTTGTSATFNDPYGLALDSTAANLIVADRLGQVIRQIAVAGVQPVTSLAGVASNRGNTDGTGTSAKFNFPQGLAVSGSGATAVIYIADTTNQTIRVGAPTAAPGITGQPSNATFTVGVTASVTFGVTATGNPTVSYQWQRAPASSPTSFSNITDGTANGLTVSGATTATLTISAAATTNNLDVFQVVVSNGVGSSATSTARTLTVQQAPSITSAAATTFSVGVAGSFNVTATGQPAPTFSVTAGTFPGFASLSTAGALTGTPSTTGGPYTFTITATNTFADASVHTTTQSFTLNVQNGAAITTQPSNQSAAIGASTSFTVVASGSPAPSSYQWQRQPYGTVGFLTLANDGTYGGVGTATLTITGATLAMSGDQFRVVVSNGVGSPTTSSAATLTVTLAPSFTSASTTNFVAATAGTFTVTATGSPATMTYSVIAGTFPSWASLNSASGLISGTPSDTSGSPFSFTIQASNGAAPAATQVFTLTVLPTSAVPAFTTQPANQSVNLGQSATYTVVATGIPQPSYQWQRQPAGTTGFVSLADGGAYSGATTATLTVSSVSTGMSGDRFQCVATNASGTATSTAVSLAVNVATTVSTFAGQAGVSGSLNGTGTAATFNNPGAIAVDGFGNFYVADTINSVIRKITSAGVVSTFAGVAGAPGNTDGAGTAAKFNGPYGVATDSAGNVYVADTFNQTIRVITPTGVVSTLAGTAGRAGYANGTGADALFNYPTGVAVGPGGLLYVTDSASNTIRQIAPGGVVSTLAGVPGASGSADGTINVGLATGTARFASPNSLAVDAAGNIYVADSLNHAIRKITSSGIVTTLAGTAGAIGSVDGTGAAARFNQPNGITVDSSGNVYVADTFNHVIRKITATGIVTTLAGLAGSSGSADGTGNTVRFNQPYGICVDGSGNLYIADTKNSTIRRSGSVTAPTISTQPQNVTAGAGLNTTFTVGAIGSPAPGFQWQRQPAGTTGFVNLANDTTYSGVTTATLTVTAVTSAMEGDQFRCVVSNLISPDAISSAATLSVTVIVPPVFTSTNATTFTAGQAGSFTVTATGTPAPTFTATGLPSWASLNASTGVIGGAPSDASGSPFTVTVTANNGATATQTLTLTVVLPVTSPSITTQPSSVTLNRGQTATFTVVAAGTAPLTYQWRRNGAPIVGANSATLTLANVEPVNAGLYSVVVTNSVGSATSGLAELAINTIPVIISQPRSQSVLLGGVATFSVSATATPAPSYQWRFNGAAISGATNSTLSLTNVTAANAGNYDVVVANALGQVSSALGQLTVAATASAPVIMSQPASRTAVAGGSTTLAVAATGAPAPTYQWLKNGNTITGANASTLPLNNTQATDAGSYAVVITNSAGSVTSQPVFVSVISRSLAGCYFGSFGGTLGNFAMYIRPDNTGVFLGYLSGSSLAINNQAFAVADTGSFSFTSGGLVITGVIGSDGTIGGAVAGVSSTTLTGSRSADVGITQALVGYYQAGAANSSGTAVAVIGATGQIFVLTQTATFTEGIAGTISSSGSAALATTRQSIVVSVNADTATLTVTASAGSSLTTFQGASEDVVATQRLANISTRARVDAGASIAIAGFVITGQDSKPVLIRAIGPTLANFGITSALAAPKLELFRGTTVIATNTGWTTAGNTAAIVAATAQSGGFALPSNSADSVIFTTLPPGPYTAQVSGVGTAAGVALIEVYDLSAAAAGQKLFNISTRANAGTGDATLIAGIAVTGASPKRVLIRAVGPGLAQFGLTGLLAQPVLKLIRDGTTVAQNTGISTSPDAAAITAASAQVGAFALPVGSADSALLVSLAPGNYSATVTGVNNTSGVAIVEVYEVP